MAARIGIDLGTTNSVPALVYEDGPHPIPRDDVTTASVPSVAYFRWASGLSDVVVGNEADQHLRRVVRSIKRLMGRTYTDALRQQGLRYFSGGDVALVREAGNDLKVEVRGEGYAHTYWPHEIAGLILDHIRRRAEKTLGTRVDAAVITVPAYFEDPHRQATLEAAKLAQLPVLEPLLDEPSAAALAYAHLVGLPIAEPLLVIDWGGGTLDLTVLVRDQNEWVQLALEGDLYLGGDEVDHALAEFVLAREGVPLTILDEGVARHKLLREIRAAKHLLSSATEASLLCGGLTHPASGRPLMIAATLTRDEFDGCVKPLVDRVMQRVRMCLSHPDVPPGSITNVLLVGGSTRIPLLRSELAQIPGLAIRCDVDPLAAVAFGAALYASTERPKVFRLCPYGYAVEAGGEMIEVIPPGQEVPTPDHLPYHLKPDPRTRYPHQSVFRLTLHRFTRHDSDLRESPGGARLFGRDLPPLPAGTPLSFELWLDQNKVLKARVRLPDGAVSPEVNVSMAEVGPEALRTQLLEKTLEAEAHVEVNRGLASPLLAELNGALTEARQCLGARHGGEPEAALRHLEDVLTRLTADRDVTAPDDPRRKQHVLAWLPFFEQQLLPRCWNLLAPSDRDALLADIRAVRVMDTTGASALEMGAALDGLVGRVGALPHAPVFVGMRYAALKGVGARDREHLKQLTDAAIMQFQNGQQDQFSATCRALSTKTAEVAAKWMAWSTSAPLLPADPTLIVAPDADGL